MLIGRRDAVHDGMSFMAPDVGDFLGEVDTDARAKGLANKAIKLRRTTRKLPRMRLRLAGLHLRSAGGRTDLRLSSAISPSCVRFGGGSASTSRSRAPLSADRPPGVKPSHSGSISSSSHSLAPRAAASSFGTSSASAIYWHRSRRRHPLVDHPTARREVCWRNRLGYSHRRRCFLFTTPPAAGGLSVMGAWPAESSEK